MAAKKGKTATQLSLFSEEVERMLAQLKALGNQADIQYFGIRSRQILNGPTTTGMGFLSINPYVGCAFGCTYCYARYAHGYVMQRNADASRLSNELSEDMVKMDPWLAFERRIFVKQNAADVLARTLREGGDKYLPLLSSESILIGSATDPYQPAERNFRLTRRILEVLAHHPGLRVTIITKSPLITRDIDLLRRINRHSRVNVHLSLITLDRELARRIEPRAPTPDSRIRALKRLSEGGIKVSINCMPILPGITDNPDSLDTLVKTVSEAGATYIASCALRLDRTARLRYFPFLEQEFPELTERYKRSYAKGRYVSEKYRNGLASFMQSLSDKYGIDTNQGE